MAGENENYGGSWNDPGSPPAQGPCAAERVQGPAVGLIVTAVLGMAIQAMGILLNVAGASLSLAGGENPAAMMFQGAMGLVSGFIALALGILVLFGALKMKRLENYGFSLVAAIVAMIPCLSPCCLLGLPIGIWAVVVLIDENVKAAFKG